MSTHEVQVTLECDAAPDLSVRRFAGREAVSELFSFELDLVLIGSIELDPERLLGERATVVLSRDGVELRRIHGQLVEIRSTADAVADAVSFSATLAPHVRQALLYETQEVFLDLSIPEIVASKLELMGLSEHLELRLDDAYPKREFVVQYRESDLAFISRILEHLGISFYFEHVDGIDRMIVTDEKHWPGLEAPVRYLPRGDRQECVWRLSTTTKMIPRVYVMQEYNYRLPQVELTSMQESEAGTVGGLVEYGAHYKTPTEGRKLATVRAKERESQRRVVTGDGDVPEISPGHVAEIDGRKLLILAVEHEVVQSVGLAQSGDTKSYRSSFSAIDADVGYRPPRRTPRPRIFGVTSGLVVDTQGTETGELAKIDVVGRYLVRLRFDAAGSGERRASHPIRMAQPLAGAGYGVHFPLRPGIEVVIAFVDGDPDRPIIVGSVPNPITPSPVVNDNSVESRIKTESGLLIQFTDR